MKTLKTVLKNQPLTISSSTPTASWRATIRAKIKLEIEPELKNYAFKDEDLIIVDYYLKNKNRYNELGYQYKLATHPYVYLYSVATTKSRYLAFKQQLQCHHHLFQQNLNWEELEKLSINNFKNSNFKKKLIQTHFKNFHSYQTKPSLYLQGDFDTGKTYFFKLMSRYFLEQQQLFLFLFMPDLTRQFRTNWHEPHSEQKLDLLKNIPYLFLDDMGGENLTPYFRDEILLPLLNYRAEKGLAVFISSVLNLPQLIEHLKINTEIKHEIKALRIVNKLKKMCHFYGFDGDTKKEKNQYLP
ncbi:hypothetical protein [Candidatus Phytoplasma pyri]|uniref:hypothetical protein n=1 Tax=Candidatus Phytoplasma pyri TaxID=47566 RepID=UPI0039837F1E